MKLLASDYDGTLSFNASVMPEDKQAIEKWRAEGNSFAVVTGRSKDSLERQLKENGIEVDYMICNCGSMVYDAQGQLLESIYFDYVTGIDTICIAKASEGVISVIANDENGRHRLIVDPDLQDHRFEGLEPDMKEEEIMDLPHIAQVVVSMATPDLAFEFAED
ncbi:MAG: HAD family phosphatase, partial [Erysipelotrichaceae bacterium]|nr:HAD family phosphatase [Erysipelotrichaceae bacterium]